MYSIVRLSGLLSLLSVEAVIPVSFAVSDYRDMEPAHKDTKPCSSFSSRISMIEHFFTLVYNEFEGSHPVCVCVQMCAGQPLFCYPNGCLRRDPSYSGNNIRMKFDVATFAPALTTEKGRGYERFEPKPVVTEGSNRNTVVQPVGNEQLLPADLQYFDKKFKSFIKNPAPFKKHVESQLPPKIDSYTVIRADASGKYLTEEEYQAAEDQFRRHLQVSP